MCGESPVVCFPAVLLPCVISNTYHIDISRPDTLTATEPRKIRGVDKIEDLLKGIPFEDGTPVIESTPVPQALAA